MKKKHCYPSIKRDSIKKNLFKCGVVVILMVFVATSGCVTQSDTTIKISGAFALYPMMSIWAQEYQLLHPEIKFDLSAGGAGKGVSDALNGMVDIGMVSRDIHDEEIEQNLFWVSVAKDAVVATMHADNPVIEDILSKGITKQQFEKIFITRTITTWGQLFNDSDNTDIIRVYTRSDSCGAASTWANYLGDYEQDDLTNHADSAVDGDPNLAATVQGDVLGIGYNNINYIYDATTDEPFENLQPVPIDLNENGILDDEEDFYDTQTTMIQAIADTIYPSPPARALHLVTKQNFTGIVKEFVYWILTDGQTYVPDNGYICLSEQSIEQQLDYLDVGTRPEMP